MTVNQILKSAMECPLERPRYAYLAPLYKQAKRIAWDYLQEYARPIPGAVFNGADLKVDLPNGARIELLGAADYDSLRGTYLDGVVLDEYAYMSPDAWEGVIRPALSDRRGYAIFIGTPQGRNHFHRLYERAKARPTFLTAFWPVSQTGYVAADELAEARADMTPELYEQEYECSFDAAIRGAYYATELSAARAGNRIRELPWEPAVPVDTWWDLGWRDSTAIIFTQTIGRELRLIDYLEANGHALPWYAKALQERPYLYGGHYLPHDADKTELGSGKSLIEQLRALALRPLHIVRKVEVQEGIQAGRLLFARCWFDVTKCARLIDCLGSYHTEWDETRQDFKDKPDHDWASHGADAFRYLAVGHRQRPSDEIRRPVVYSQFDPIEHAHAEPTRRPARVITDWRIGE